MSGCFHAFYISKHNPTYLKTGEVTAEERIEKTDEFKKFLLRYINDLKKLINDSKRLNDFSTDFVIDYNEMERWE